MMIVSHSLILGACMTTSIAYNTSLCTCVVNSNPIGIEYKDRLTIYGLVVKSIFVLNSNGFAINNERAQSNNVHGITISHHFLWGL